MYYPPMGTQPSVTTLVACGRRKGLKEAILRIITLHLPDLAPRAGSVLHSLQDDALIERLLDLAIRLDEKQIRLILYTSFSHQ